MSALTRVALETLVDPAAAPGLKTVACTTLLVAFRERVGVVAGSHLAVWKYLLSLENAAVILHQFEVSHAEVAADAVRVLLDGDSGEAAKDLALAVLRGANLAAVGDQELVTLVDQVLVEERVRQISWLIERVHEERGLSPQLLVAIRDRLAGSVLSAIRVAAVEVGALLPRLDEPFALRMLSDSAPAVRTEVADQLARAGELDRAAAVTILREQLTVESHAGPLKAIHFALAALIRQPRARDH